ncbi:MAG: hypothetical protein GY719_08790 [bacterium]|nr:hypothetical protein [bacterium]
MSDVIPIQFLTTLYPEPLGPGQLLLRTRSRRNGRLASHWCHSLDEAARKAMRHAGNHDVYWAVALHDKARARGIAQQRRTVRSDSGFPGCTASATLLPALWAVLDVAGPDRLGRSLPPDRAAALTVLEGLPYSPSILIDSGGGFHAYWLLHEPLELTSLAQRRHARDLVARLQGALARRAREHGWTLHDCSDLGHLLRFPGTLNHKLDPSREVKVVQFPLAPGIERYRYHPEDFAALPEPPVSSLLERLLRAVGDLLYDGPPGDFPEVFAGCSWLRHCYEERTFLSTDELTAAITIIARCTAGGIDGRRLLHRMCADHPGYDSAFLDQLIDHALATWEPRPCTYMDGALGAQDHCRSCEHFERKSTPLALGCAPLTLADLVETGAAPAPLLPLGGPPAETPPPAPAPGAPATEPPDAESQARPLPIVITVRQGEVNDQALAALIRREPNLFHHRGALVRLTRTGDGQPTIRPVSQTLLRELLARHCTFLRPARTPGAEPRQVPPPRWTVRALHGRGTWPGLTEPPDLAVRARCA